jgi:hypothetical protein
MEDRDSNDGTKKEHLRGWGGEHDVRHEGKGCKERDSGKMGWTGGKEVRFILCREMQGR